MALAVALAVVVVDQVTTTLAEDHLHHPVHLLGPLGLDLGFNTGSAFSLFTSFAPVLVVVAVVVAVALCLLAWRARSATAAVGFGLVLGGAVGNLVDRLARGHHGAVVDFITLSHWPTFNVADACIVVGLALVVVTAYRPAPVPTAPSGAEDETATAPGPGDGR